MKKIPSRKEAEYARAYRPLPAGMGVGRQRNYGARQTPAHENPDAISELLDGVRAFSGNHDQFMLYVHLSRAFYDDEKTVGGETSLLPAVVKTVFYHGLQFRSKGDPLSLLHDLCVHGPNAVVSDSVVDLVLGKQPEPVRREMMRDIFGIFFVDVPAGAPLPPEERLSYAEEVFTARDPSVVSTPSDEMIRRLAKFCEATGAASFGMELITRREDLFELYRFDGRARLAEALEAVEAVLSGSDAPAIPAIHRLVQNSVSYASNSTDFKLGDSRALEAIVANGIECVRASASDEDEVEASLEMARDIVDAVRIDILPLSGTVYTFYNIEAGSVFDADCPGWAFVSSFALAGGCFMRAGHVANHLMTIFYEQVRISLNGPGTVISLPLGSIGLTCFMLDNRKSVHEECKEFDEIRDRFQSSTELMGRINELMPPVLRSRYRLAFGGRSEAEEFFYPLLATTLTHPVTSWYAFSNLDDAVSTIAGRNARLFQWTSLGEMKKFGLFPGVEGRQIAVPSGSLLDELRSNMVEYSEFFYLFILMACFSYLFKRFKSTSVSNGSRISVFLGLVGLLPLFYANQSPEGDFYTYSTSSLKYEGVYRLGVGKNKVLHPYVPYKVPLIIGTQLGPLAGISLLNIDSQWSRTIQKSLGGLLTLHYNFVTPLLPKVNEAAVSSLSQIKDWTYQIVLDLAGSKLAQPVMNAAILNEVYAGMNSISAIPWVQVPIEYIDMFVFDNPYVPNIPAIVDMIGSMIGGLTRTTPEVKLAFAGFAAMGADVASLASGDGFWVTDRKILAERLYTFAVKTTFQNPIQFVMSVGWYGLIFYITKVLTQRRVLTVQQKIKVKHLLVALNLHATVMRLVGPSFISVLATEFGVVPDNVPFFNPSGAGTISSTVRDYANVQGTYGKDDLNDIVLGVMETIRLAGVIRPEVFSAMVFAVCIYFAPNFTGNIGVSQMGATVTTERPNLSPENTKILRNMLNKVVKEELEEVRMGILPDSFFKSSERNLNSLLGFMELSLIEYTCKLFDVDSLLKVIGDSLAISDYATDVAFIGSKSEEKEDKKVIVRINIGLKYNGINIIDIYRTLAVYGRVAIQLALLKQGAAHIKPSVKTAEKLIDFIEMYKKNAEFSKGIVELEKTLGNPPSTTAVEDAFYRNIAQKSMRTEYAKFLNGIKPVAVNEKRVLLAQQKKKVGDVDRAKEIGPFNVWQEEPFKFASNETRINSQTVLATGLAVLIPMAGLARPSILQALRKLQEIPGGVGYPSEKVLGLLDLFRGSPCSFHQDPLAACTDAVLTSVSFVMALHLAEN